MDMQAVRTDEQRSPYVWAPWANVGIGVALIVAALLRTSTEPMRLSSSNMIMGIIITAVALIAFFSSTSERSFNVSWINALAGIWVMISSYMGTTRYLAFESIVLGALVLIVSLVSVADYSEHQELEHRFGMTPTS